MKTTTRLCRQLLWSLATTALLAATFQVAVPLHAARHAKLTCASTGDCGTSPDAPEHDADKCSVCHFLFGLSGKTLAPHATGELPESTLHFFNVLYDRQTPAVSSTHRIIPRAPPVL
jgi:hypothetical protein